MNPYIKYAQDIQTVRLAIEDQSILQHKGFIINQYSTGCFEYRISDGCSTSYAFAYLEERKNHTIWVSNQYLQSRIIYDQRCEYIRMSITGDTIPLELGVITEPTEEWLFQQSLLCSDEELQALTVFNVLRSTESIYNYFSLNTDYLEAVLKRMNKNYD